MANTYVQLNIHIVFAVRDRSNQIHSNYKDELYKYITGLIKNAGHKLLVINGMPDHLHIFISMKPNMSVSDLVRNIKRSSALFINEKKWTVGNFQWQKGFGAFSYSNSQISDVVSYIENQEKHHRKRSFREEYIKMLEDFNIKYDNKYLFKWVE